MLDNGWLELVREDGTKVYVCGQYLQLVGSGSTEQGCCAQEGTVVCRRLNVRKGAGVASARIDQFRRGEKVTIVGCDGAHEWYKIIWNDGYAWVHANYIQK